jgi:hypothetical protein
MGFRRHHDLRIAWRWGLSLAKHANLLTKGAKRKAWVDGFGRGAWFMIVSLAEVFRRSAKPRFAGNSHLA